MIIDFSVANFRSIQAEQTLSMNVEGGRERHSDNYTLIEGEKLAILRSAAILGANASGKSNLLKAVAALKWLVVTSGSRKDGQKLLPYEPFKLSTQNTQLPVRLEIEFVVPSGVRYQYIVTFNQDRILTESLHSFAKQKRAMVFQRDENDTWETIKFGATYKGGSRKFPFFPNSTYVSRAGNDASSPQSIQEIFQYFRDIMLVHAGQGVILAGYLKDPARMKAVADLICLADTGVAKVTSEENDNAGEIKFPEDMPDEIKDILLEQSSTSYKFWMKAENEEFIKFNESDMSDGTVRLFGILPLILNSLSTGSPLLVDEMDAHLHTHILSLFLQLFHDHEINAKGAQLVFTTHDTNVLNSNILRRDQIWLVSKEHAATTVRGLDEYNKKYVRPGSPFETFYKDGRLGALPRLSHTHIREAVLKVVSAEGNHEVGRQDA